MAAKGKKAVRLRRKASPPKKSGGRGRLRSLRTVLWVGLLFVTGSLTYLSYRVSPPSLAWTSTLPAGAKQLNTLAVHPVSPDQLLAGTRAGLYASLDGGNTWQRPWDAAEGQAGGTRGRLEPASEPGKDKPSDLLKQEILAVAADPGWSKIYVSGHEQGVLASGDQGRTWVPAAEGLPSRDVHLLASRGVRGSLLAWLPGYGLYETVNGGGNWLPVESESRVWNLTSIMFRPSDPRILYAALDGAVLSLDLQGRKWNRLGKPPGGALVLSHEPRSGDLIYAGQKGLGLGNPKDWKWSDLRSFGKGYPAALAVHYLPPKPEIIYLGTASGRLNRSFNGGATWYSIVPGNASGKNEQNPK